MQTTTMVRQMLAVGEKNKKKKKQTKLGACERHTVEVGARGGLKL